MRFWTNRRLPARLSRSSRVFVRATVRSFAPVRAPLSWSARSSSCCAIVAASARSCDARSRCSVAESRVAWCRCSSCPNARVCSARLHLRAGLGQPVAVAPSRLDRRPYLLPRRQLGTQRLDRPARLCEPGLRAGLPLPCARDLTLGDPHALEPFLHFLVCPLEAREVAQCGVDRRLRPFETRDTLRHLRDGVREPFCVRLNSSELLGVGLEVCHRLGESAELRHESVGLRLDVPDGAGGLL